MATNSYRTDPPADQEKARMLALDLLDPNKYVNEQQICYVARAFLELSTSSNGPSLPFIDRSDAVNLASTVLSQREDPEITTKGIVALAQAVMDMDSFITEYSATLDREKLYRKWGKDDVR